MNSLGPSLVAELAAAVAKHELQVTLEDEIVATTFCDLTEVTDRGAELIRMARLLARVAAALPRS